MTSEEETSSAPLEAARVLSESSTGSSSVFTSTEESSSSSAFEQGPPLDRRRLSTWTAAMRKSIDVGKILTVHALQTDLAMQTMSDYMDGVFRRVQLLADVAHWFEFGSIQEKPNQLLYESAKHDEQIANIDERLEAFNAHSETLSSTSKRLAEVGLELLNLFRVMVEALEERDKKRKKDKQVKEAEGEKDGEGLAQCDVRLYGAAELKDDLDKWQSSVNTMLTIFGSSTELSRSASNITNFGKVFNNGKLVFENMTKMYDEQWHKLNDTVTQSILNQKMKDYRDKLDKTNIAIEQKEVSISKLKVEIPELNNTLTNAKQEQVVLKKRVNQREREVVDLTFETKLVDKAAVAQELHEELHECKDVTDVLAREVKRINDIVKELEAQVIQTQTQTQPQIQTQTQTQTLTPKSLKTEGSPRMLVCKKSQLIEPVKVDKSLSISIEPTDRAPSRTVTVHMPRSSSSLSGSHDFDVLQPRSSPVLPETESFEGFLLTNASSTSIMGVSSSKFHLPSKSTASKTVTGEKSTSSSESVVQKEESAVKKGRSVAIKPSFQRPLGHVTELAKAVTMKKALHGRTGVEDGELQTTMTALTVRTSSAEKRLRVAVSKDMIKNKERQFSALEKLQKDKDEMPTMFEKERSDSQESADIKLKKVVKVATRPAARKHYVDYSRQMPHRIKSASSRSETEGRKSSSGKHRVAGSSNRTDQERSDKDVGHEGRQELETQETEPGEDEVDQLQQNGDKDQQTEPEQDEKDNPKRESEPDDRKQAKPKPEESADQVKPIAHQTVPQDISGNYTEDGSKESAHVSDTDIRGSFDAKLKDMLRKRKEKMTLNGSVETGVRGFKTLRDATKATLIQRNLKEHADVLGYLDVEDDKPVEAILGELGHRLEPVLEDFRDVFSNAVRQLSQESAKADSCNILPPALRDGAPAGLEAWSTANEKSKTKEMDYAGSLRCYRMLWLMYNKQRAALWEIQQEGLKGRFHPIMEDVEGEEREMETEEKTISDAMPKVTSYSSEEPEKKGDMTKEWKQELKIAKDAFNEGYINVNDYMEQVGFFLKMAALLQQKSSMLGNSYPELRLKQALAQKVDAILRDLGVKKQKLNQLKRQAGIEDYCNALTSLDNVERAIRIEQDQNVIVLSMKQAHMKVKRKLVTKMSTCAMVTIAEGTEVELPTLPQSRPASVIMEEEEEEEEEKEVLESKELSEEKERKETSGKEQSEIEESMESESGRKESLHTSSSPITIVIASSDVLDPDRASHEAEEVGQKKTKRDESQDFIQRVSVSTGNLLVRRRSWGLQSSYTTLRSGMDLTEPPSHLTSSPSGKFSTDQIALECLEESQDDADGDNFREFRRRVSLSNKDLMNRKTSGIQASLVSLRSCIDFTEPPPHITSSVSNKFMMDAGHTLGSLEETTSDDAALSGPGSPELVSPPDVHGKKYQHLSIVSARDSKDIVLLPSPSSSHTPPTSPRSSEAKRMSLLPFLSGAGTTGVESSHRDSLSSSGVLGIDSVIAQIPCIEKVKVCLRTKTLPTPPHRTALPRLLRERSPVLTEPSTSLTPKESFIARGTPAPMSPRKQVSEPTPGYEFQPTPPSGSTSKRSSDIKEGRPLSRELTKPPSFVFPSYCETLLPPPVPSYHSGETLFPIRSAPGETLHPHRTAKLSGRPSSPAPSLLSPRLDVSQASSPVMVDGQHYVFASSDSSAGEEFPSQVLPEIRHRDEFIPSPTAQDPVSRTSRTPSPTRVQRDSVSARFSMVDSPRLAPVSRISLTTSPSHRQRDSLSARFSSMDAPWPAPVPSGRQVCLPRIVEPVAVSEATAAAFLKHDREESPRPPKESVDKVMDWVQSQPDSPIIVTCPPPSPGDPVTHQRVLSRSVRRILKKGRQKLQVVDDTGSTMETTDRRTECPGWPTPEAVEILPVMESRLLCLDVNQTFRKAGRTLRMVKKRQLNRLQEPAIQHIWNKFL